MLVVEHVSTALPWKSSNLRRKLWEDFCDHQVISTHIFQGFARVRRSSPSLTSLQ